VRGTPGFGQRRIAGQALDQHSAFFGPQFSGDGTPHAVEILRAAGAVR
jgi:hypothetical protein